MERAVSLSEISDGKLYERNDLVKANCSDCKGCSACCRGMGNSIMLDPLDIYRLSSGLNKKFEEFLADKIELNIVEGIVLPNMKMAGDLESCSFLNSEGRCSIHPYRPGICRLFPLGRFYEEGGFKYFLQVHECKKPNRTKVKVSKWIDTPDIKEYEQFVKDWHYFIKDMQNFVKTSMDENQIKNMNMQILKMFYTSPYDTNEDFYAQFQERLCQFENSVV